MSQATDLQIVHSNTMPIMSIEQAAERRSILTVFIKSIMVDGIDFGPAFKGADKPTLLKPGAEKLITFFGLTSKPIVIESVEDWTGENHGGEPFFYYWYRYELWRGNNLIAAADGSCNSWESKYRYRTANRTCPNCGAEAIIKGKKEYGGGWLCWPRKDGCGAKWPDGAPEIEGQEVGRVLNPDPADLVNTIKKMGQKRAFIAAALLGINVSDFFTQDMEDFVIDSEAVVDAPGTNKLEQRKPKSRQERASPPPEPSSWKQDGPTGKQPPIKGGNWGGNWTAAALALAARCPYYQDAQGEADWFHMLGAAGKLGWLQINDDNVNQVIADLEKYAKQAAAERELGERLAAEAIANQDMPV